MPIARVSSEEELDVVEKPVREAFTAFLSDAGLLGTDQTVIGMTFRTGGVHFAAKSLEFVPPGQPVLLAGTSLTRDEVEFLEATGHPVFNFDQRFDNELVYEMIMDGTSGSFGWVDADCFVLNPRIWRDLLAPMADDVASHAAFTYEPLGFAKTPLVVWDRKARDVLVAEGTTLNSYAPLPTNVGRASPYSISRLVTERHQRYLEQVLGVDENGELSPHFGLLDIYENGRTVPSTRRADALGWFGPDVQRTGWLVDTPMVAGVVLRAHGLTNKAVVADNVQISTDIIHVGASSYRERMRQEGADTVYLARFRLTDLFEVLLADDAVRRGLGESYAELSAVQTKRLNDEAGIPPDEIKAAARAMLEDHGVDLAPLRDDARLDFLF
ncbi:hypothetical protein ACWEIJ_20255 [Lentzea sp. NPDC004789]